MSHSNGRAYRKALRHALVALAVSALFATAGSAGAEAASTDPASALRDAESAFQSVDFATALDAARRGLTSGHASPAETARLHVLAGTSAASLGNDQEARSHFLVALAIQPTLKLEQDLSPKVRDPYLEALGYWGTQPDRLALKVKHDERLSRLTFHLVDPAQLGKKVRLYIRLHDKSDFDGQTLECSPRAHAELPQQANNRGFDYFVTLVDEHGNRLVELGSEDEPITVVPRRIDRRGSSRTQDQLTSGPARAQRSLWLPMTFMGGALVAGGIGAYFHVRRESNAERWNGKTCEQPGLTRLQQCGDVNTERATMERLAIGSYAVSGALLATGVTLLWLGSGSNQERDPSRGQTSCGIDPVGLSIGCEGHF